MPSTIGHVAAHKQTEVVQLAFFAGTSSTAIRTPDSAALDITGDIEIVARYQPYDWTPSGLTVIVGKWGPTTYSYGFFLNTDGTLSLYNQSGELARSTAAVGATDRTIRWLKVTLDVDNGASSREAKFYTATDDGTGTEPSSWTQLGTTRTGAVVSITAGGAELAIGSTEGVNQKLIGNVYRVIVRNGIGGTAAADFNPTDWRSGSSWVSSTTGETWTLYGDAAVFRYGAGLVFEGDSLTAGTGATTGNNYPIQVRRFLNTAAEVFNYGTPSDTVASMVASTTTVDGVLARAGANSIAILWAGTNDLYFGGSAATALSNISTWCSGRRSLGYKVIVLTMLPRSDAGTPGTFETDRQTVNTSIRANWATYADALVDVAADTRIGDAGDELNTTYFSGDKVHMVDAGYEVVARLVAAGIRSLGVA